MSDLPDIDEALEALTGADGTLGDLLVDGREVSPKLVAVVVVVEDAIGAPTCIARYAVAGGVRTVTASEECVAAWFHEAGDEFEEAAATGGEAPTMALTWAPDGEA